MQSADLNTDDTVRALARKIACYEEFLRLLSSLGNSLRQIGHGKSDDEVGAVGRSSDALAAVLAPHEFAFYCAERDGDVNVFPRVIPHGPGPFPETLDRPEQGTQQNLQSIPLDEDVFGLAYWNLPSLGRRWALVIHPTATGYIDPTASFSIKLFGDCLAGISAVRAKEAAKEQALLRLLDEQQVVLSDDTESLRQEALGLHSELVKLGQLLEGVHRMLETAVQAREKVRHSVTRLSKSIKGLRPSGLGLRDQLESERRAELKEILGKLPNVEWNGVNKSTSVTTRPGTLKGAITFFRGELCELIGEELPHAEFHDKPARTPAIKLRMEVSGELHMDVVFDQLKLEGPTQEAFSKSLRALVESQPTTEGELRLVQPLAWWWLVYHLKKELKISVDRYGDGIRLTIPSDLVHPV